MNITLNERATVYDGRVRPLITVVGPSGVGKSLLAKKIARIITRAEQSPNVLLVDADIFSRGLTARIENGAELKCKYLHDAIAGGHTEMEPIELTEDLLGLEEWASLPEEGRVFFLPSIREEARNPFVEIGHAERSTLRETLLKVITSAADACRADCIVVDTPSIAEPCAAIFTSVCNLMIRVGDPDKTDKIVDEHQRKLSELEPVPGSIYVETVFNKIDAQAGKSVKIQIPIDHHHLIPALRGLQGSDVEAIPDNIDFDNRVLVILQSSLRVYPKLIPRWYAPLPPQWRKVARIVGESAPKKSYPWELAPKFAPLFLERAVMVAGTGISAATCLLLTSSIWKSDQTSMLAYLGLTIGVCSLAMSGAWAWWMFRDFKACLVAASYLTGKKLDWILKHLRLKPKHIFVSSPEKREKLAKRKLYTLHKVFDTLWRCLEESQKKFG